MQLSLTKSIKLPIAILIWLLLQTGGVAQSGGRALSDDIVTGDIRDNTVFLQQQMQPAGPKEELYETRVNELLAKMNLREKVGQMTQLEIGMVCDGKDQGLTIDPQKLQKAIAQYGVGSILNVKDEALPLDRWHELIGQIQTAAKNTRLHIPVLYGIDSIHGANYVQGSTLFPQPLTMAATWNPLLALRAAQITAAETRAADIPWNFSPVLDIGRQPLWPRIYETYGEDPNLAKTMGVAAVRGYEGSNVADKNSVAACLKHYVGYSGPVSGRDRTPALIPEITLREYYLPTFRAAVEAGAHTLMVNSGEVNGVPGHINKYLLNDVLRGEMKFKGMVVTDWEDIKKLVNVHHAAATEKDAVRIAIMAGIDMSMVPSDYSFSDLLYQLVQEGSIPMSRVDESVRRILRLKFQLGLFDQAVSPVNSHQPIGTPESRQVSLQAARESITLLKNENNLLPLRKNMRVLVTGPTSDSLVSLNNGWSYTWQGDRPGLYPKDCPTLKQAIEAKIGADHVSYVPGTDLDKVIDIDRAVAAARQADAIILALGEASYAETPGNIEDLDLPAAQIQLAQAIIETGKPVVLVLIEGRPRIINSIADRIPAIMMGYNASNEGGQAISDVLFGDYNPSGRLPFTYPRHPNALLTYDHKRFETDDQAFGLKAYRPQFDFGSGLSYTTFKYSNLMITPQRLTRNANVSISVKVENTGTRAGKEVAEIYLSDLVASITPPGKRLVRFAKIALQPGQTQTLTFTLTPPDLSFINADLKPTIEPGDFKISVGGLESQFTVLQGSGHAVVGK
jgi:beta-glucosidase